jgi:Leucine-rich repeat (LRR) protein
MRMEIALERIASWKEGTYLNLSDLGLTSLPSLPSSLTILYCNNNQLTSLPSIPSSLTILYCNNNQLTSLPSLPSSLRSLSCNNNQLTSLPSLPSFLIELYCENNPFSLETPRFKNESTYSYYVRLEEVEEVKSKKRIIREITKLKKS